MLQRLVCSVNVVAAVLPQPVSILGWSRRESDRRKRVRFATELCAPGGLCARLALSFPAKPFHKINYRNIPVLDLTAPTRAQLAEMGEFIGDHSKRCRLCSL